MDSFNRQQIENLFQICWFVKNIPILIASRLKIFFKNAFHLRAWNEFRFDGWKIRTPIRTLFDLMGWGRHLLPPQIESKSWELDICVWESFFNISNRMNCFIDFDNFSFGFSNDFLFVLKKFKSETFFPQYHLFITCMSFWGISCKF